MSRSVIAIGRCLLVVSVVAAFGCGSSAPDDAIGETSNSVTGQYLLAPTSDVSANGIVGTFSDVNDGTSFAGADDNTTFVRGQGGVASSDHTVAYSGGPVGKVASVDVAVRADQGTSTGKLQVELYDGTTLLGTGASHTLGASYADYTDTFSSLSVSSANNLRTKVLLTNTGSSGSVRYTQIFIGVTLAKATCPGTGPKPNLVLRYPGSSTVFTKDRLQGPAGGPFTRDVQADGSASTAGTGGAIVSYAYSWWDGTSTPPASANKVTHTYGYNLGTKLDSATTTFDGVSYKKILPAYENGLGLKKITLTVTDACGNVASTTSRAVILRDHIGFGDWNPETTAEHDENIVNRGLDLQDIVTAVIDVKRNITPPEPLGGARDVLESDNGYGFRHRIPARLMHLNKIDPTQSSYNVTWYHVLNDRHSPAYSGNEGSWPSWPPNGQYNVNPKTGAVDPTQTWAYTDPKPSVWFKQQFLNWKQYGEPFYFNVADEANTHVPENQAYWTDKTRPKSDQDVWPTITGATWAKMVSVVIGWMDEVEVYNCAGFLVGLTSSGFDNTFASDNLPLITNDWEFLALSGYNYYNGGHWKPFKDIVANPLYESRALGKTLFFWESGCVVDPKDATRRGTWFSDAGDVLRGKAPFSGTDTMSNLDNEVIVFNSGEGRFGWDMDGPTESALKTISNYSIFLP